MGHHHRSRRPTSSDSGYDTNSDQPNSPVHQRTKHPAYERSTSSQIKAPISPSEKSRFDSLLALATRADVTPSTGTHLHDIQLSSLTLQQLDELARLVSERGVVFFHDQDLTPADQLRIFEHYGAGSTSRIVERNSRFVKIRNNLNDHGENFTLDSERRDEWSSDHSFEGHPPSYSMVKANGLGPDTIWVSQYSAYDALSKHMKGFVDDLQALHTFGLQYSSVANLSTTSARLPTKSLHPAILTHPVTGLRALNVSPANVSSFGGLSPRESSKLVQLLSETLDDTASDHPVRFSWTAGSVAMWDNRCVARKTLPGWSTGVFNCFETVVEGEKPSFNPSSRSLADLTHKLNTDEEEHRRTKARYNNTPLRRILRRQTNGPETASSSSSGDEDAALKLEPVLTTPEERVSSSQQDTASSSEKPQTSTDNAQGLVVVAEDQKHDGDVDTDAVITVEKNTKGEETTVRVQVTFRSTATAAQGNSPLRRIIQRQVSKS